MWRVYRSIDIAKELDCDMIVLWLGREKFGGGDGSAGDFQKVIAAGVRTPDYFTYIDKAGGNAVKAYAESVKENDPLFYSSIVSVAREGMKEKVMAAMRVFSGRCKRRSSMHCISYYQSPLGKMLLAADEIGLTGLWFEGQKSFALRLDKEHEERELPVFIQTKRWLELYFAGKKPDFDVPLHFIGTDFQKEVWEILCRIPYGQTATYGQIAETLAKKRGCKSMSAQAVGGAVGRNGISVIVPCHRVVGADGSLTGYAGGMDKKIALLKLEGSF